MSIEMDDGLFSALNNKYTREVHPDDPYLRQKIKKRVERSRGQTTSQTEFLENNGHHVTKCDRSIGKVIKTLSGGLFPFFSGVYDVSLEGAHNGALVDIRCEINTNTSQGIDIVEITKRKDFQLQVASSDHGVIRFIQDHAKRARDRAAWLERGMIVTAPAQYETTVADISWQMLLHSGCLFHPEVVNDFFSVLPYELQRVLIDDQVLPDVLRRRYPLIKKFGAYFNTSTHQKNGSVYTGDIEKDVSFIFDEFQDAYTTHYGDMSEV